MRRIPALLCVVAGLAAAPASVTAGPSTDPGSTARSQTVEKLEWSTAKARLGVMVMSLTPELRMHFNAPEDRGVLVARVEPSTPAATAGIEVGDVIVAVRGEKIDAAPDVLSALADVRAGAHATIELVRDGKSRTLDATLADSVPTSTMSPLWLGDWIRAYDTHHPFVPLFDERSWFDDWLKPLKPLAQTSHDANPIEVSSWLDKLRELFAPKTEAVCQRS
jgi:membrane-associated protease RseP (regulator of RpoE activity)